LAALIFYWQSQQWPCDTFWQAVETATRLAKAETPEASEGTIGQLILKEWLSMSVPLGRA
jgi:hypothetical protein